MKGRRSHPYVIVDDYKEFGRVTIKLISSQEVLERIAVDREEEGWLVKWAVRSTEEEEKFIIVKTYYKPIGV